MQRYFVQDDCFKENKIYLNGSEVHHIKNVMRFVVGDRIEVFNYSGKGYLAKIESIAKKEVMLQIEKALEYSDNTLNITLAQSLIKKDKFELVLQKATELGVKRIIPLQTQYGVVKIHDFGMKKQRYETIVREASEQSERIFLPEIAEMTDVYHINYHDYDYVFTAYARQDKMSLFDKMKDIDSSKKVLLLIGPEGGFSPKEIEYLGNNSHLISLGETILRSETAAIYLISAIRLIWSK